MMVLLWCLQAVANGRSADVVDLFCCSPPQVSRTSKGQQIPVYTDFKNGRTRQLTVIRRITGNVDALREELRKVTGGAAVSVRPGRVEVEGDRSKELKTWLMGLGF